MRLKQNTFTPLVIVLVQTAKQESFTTEDKTAATRWAFNMERYKIKPYQQDAVDRMHNGCLLNIGTGSGKSFMSILYYWTKVCDGVYTDDEFKPMKNPRPLLIITTPKKRDEKEWDKDIGETSSAKSYFYRCGYNCIWYNLHHHEQFLQIIYIYVNRGGKENGTRRNQKSFRES